MRIDDLRQLDHGSTLEADVCLVGSGPAGWAIADELSGSGLQVLILESGGLDEEPEDAALSAIRDVGAPTFNGRTRALGGTSRSWFGRCTPLEPIDLEQRPWVAGSGWPLSPDELGPHLARAAARLQATLWSDGEPPPPRGWPAALPAVDPARLSPVWWQDTVPLDSAAALFRGRCSEVRVLLHATVTQLDTDPDARTVHALEVASAPGRGVRVRARLVILCAGGLENARILLYSNRVRPGGLGNDRDLVGRHLMDHPRDATLPVRIPRRDQPEFRRRFGPHRLTVSTGARHAFRLGLGLSPEVQRAERLLGAAAIVEEIGAESDPVAALLRLRRREPHGRAEDVRHVLSAPLATARAVRAMARDEVSARTVDALGFQLISEQLPDPDSRVRLSAERDPLGLPLAEVDWRLHELELASQTALAAAIDSELRRLGIADPELADWITDRGRSRPRLTDGCHPSGTTRMADDPRHGVVDRDCRVHGLDNLYVAGSSVFPTAGHANPTLTIVALALRLAGHVRRVLAPRRPAPARSATVAVTGATGFIGGHLTRVLLERDTQVRCLVRGDDAGRLPARTQVEQVDLRSAPAVRAAVGGAEVVFHCAFDWASPAWNHAALDNLIDACVQSGARLVHLSSFVVYEGTGSGVRSEDSARVTDGEGEGYPAVKAALEAKLRGAIQERGLAATILQPTNVYGPGSRNWTERPADMLRFGTVVLPAPGDGRISLVHVEDLVAAMVAAGRSEAAVGEAFIIDGDRAPTWREFYAAIAAAIGTAPPRLRPLPELRRAGSAGARLRRVAGDPSLLVHSLWRVPPAHRVLRRAIDTLPLAAGRQLLAFLEQPSERRRGACHLPNIDFTTSAVTYSTEKARRLLGYEPRLDFTTGMAATAQYLGQYVRFGTGEPRRGPAGEPLYA